MPLEKAELIISLEPMEALRYLPWLSNQVTIVTNSAPFINIESYPSKDELDREYSKIPNKVILDAEKIAKESTGTVRTANMVILGAASSFIDLPYESLQDAIRHIFSRKGEEIIQMNLKAMEAGRSFAAASQA